MILNELYSHLFEKKLLVARMLLPLDMAFFIPSHAMVFFSGKHELLALHARKSVWQSFSSPNRLKISFSTSNASFSQYIVGQVLLNLSNS